MADSQGTDAPQASQGSAPPEGTQAEPPKSLSNEDVNRAITARLRDFEKKLEGKLTESFSGIGSKLDEFSKLIAAPKTTQQESQDEGDKAAAPSQQAKDPEVIALKRQLTELKNTLKAQEEAAKAAQAKARDANMRKTLVEKLGALGVDASRARHAVGYLVDVTRAVAADGDDRIVFRDVDGEPLDIDAGLRAWIGSEDGKLYLPPRGVAGSGDSKTQSGTAGRSNAPTDPMANLNRLMADRFKIVR